MQVDVVRAVRDGAIGHCVQVIVVVHPDLGELAHALRESYLGLLDLTRLH